MRFDPEFRRLCEEEYGAVYRSVFLLCRRPDVAEEATQEAFVRALERWGRLRSKPWAGGWVTTTALNVARRLLRKRRDLGVVPGSNVEQDADEALALWDAVSRLPLRQQQAVVLYYRLGFPAAQVAEVMGTREPTIRAYLARARQTLERHLEEEHDGARPDHLAP
jgi:RNA polymerase sigma-70 factor (ECF subfamily)